MPGVPILVEMRFRVKSSERLYLMTVQTKRSLSLPYHFEELLHNIEPPAQRKEVASRIPNDVRNFLEDHQDLQTVAPHSRLVGSYRRNTATCEIKDVDFVVLLDPDYADGEPSSAIEDVYDALEELPEALGYGGRAQVLRRQRRSMHVDFEGEDFHLDVVPAVAPDGLDEPLLVPDREWERWISSDPLGYLEALSELNKATGDKAVPLAKLLKHWRTVQMWRGRPKGYWMEALVYRHLDKGWVETEGKGYAELFTDLLRSVQAKFLPKLSDGGVPRIPDPMLSHNLAFNWERTAFESFMRRLEESIGWAERALAKDEEDLDAAVALWKKVFGAEYFTDTERARKMYRAERLARGTIFVTPSGKVSDRKPKDERAVEAPRHRFYGTER